MALFTPLVGTFHSSYSPTIIPLCYLSASLRAALSENQRCEAATPKSEFSQAVVP